MSGFKGLRCVCVCVCVCAGNSGPASGVQWECGGECCDYLQRTSAHSTQGSQPAGGKLLPSTITCKLLNLANHMSNIAELSSVSCHACACCECVTDRQQ
jgi:hypothetical protein